MLNRYYEEELAKLKELAVEFAHNNPALAPMLSGTAADPDVERLLEGVAFLCGLIRQKIDDEFPEVVQELVNLLFPHYLRPLPACTMMMFSPILPLGEIVRVAAGTEIASLPVDGTPCRFRTACDLDVQPLRMANVSLVSPVGEAAALVIDFELTGLSLSQWQPGNLRLFLGGGYPDAAKLLLLLTHHVANVRLCIDGEPVESGAGCVRASGFDYELFPYPTNAFGGYRVLQEFFLQPEKFLFVDIDGLQGWTRRRQGSKFSLRLTLRDLPEWMPEIREDSLMLNVTPAINLFGHAADPINHEHRACEYRVTPEGRNPAHYQVYSVDRVVGYQQGVSKERVYQPFGMYRHEGCTGTPSYRTVLREATSSRANDVYLSVIYPPGEMPPVAETLSIRVTCTNRALPEGLKLGDISQPTSSSPDRMQFRNIRPITLSQESPIGEALLWRLISHTSLNFLSIAQTVNLKSMLSLYVLSDHMEQVAQVANRRRIDGIESVSATPETRLVGRGGVLRGQLIRIKCRQDHYAGVGDMYLFGCVIERFLADYASINSYTRVELEDAFSGTIFKWPPRLGHQTLL